MKNKYILIVLIVLILGSGFLIYKFWSAPQEKADPIANWQTYNNENAGYTFKYPKEWNAATNKYNIKNALFGPGATSESGYGGIEYVGVLASNQSLKDFIKEFNKGIEAGSASENAEIINGQNVIVSILPKASIEPTETKSVSFEKRGEVFNMYLMYKTDFVQYPEDEQRLAIFNQIIPTFKFTDEAANLIYKNEQYGFTLTLSQGWQGYSIVESSIEYGHKIVIRNPRWAEVNQFEDIPVLVYSIGQWKKWEANNFENYPTAAPIGPLERGRNANYVFATAPRYNYDFKVGWKDVENIIKTLKAF